MKNNNWLDKNGYSLEEQQQIYQYQLDDVLKNTRWYLDSLEHLVTYRLSYICYTRKKKQRVYK